MNKLFSLQIPSFHNKGHKFIQHRSTRDGEHLISFTFVRLIQQVKMVCTYNSNKKLHKLYWTIKAIRKQDKILSYNLASTCCGLDLLYTSLSEFAIFLRSILGYGETERLRTCISINNFSPVIPSDCGILNWLGMANSAETGTPFLLHDFVSPQLSRLKLLDW